MNNKTVLKKLLKEAEIYQQQGLLNEAKENYKRATEIIRANPDIQGGQVLIDSIVKRVVHLNQEINKINEALSKPLVSEQKQDLIKKLFISSGVKDADASRLDGAITLAKFGQYERALKEFEPLLERPPLRVTAAKNIIRCLLELDDGPGAQNTFNQWRTDDRFDPSQLEKIRFFANQRLKKSGMKTLPSVAQAAGQGQPAAAADANAESASTEAKDPAIPPPPIDPSEFASDEDVLDISSIGIHFDSGPLKGQNCELDVSFQSGNNLNLIIPDKERGLIDHLETGTKLENIQFFSPIAILNGSGVVTAKNKIQSGPKAGSYSLDIAILK